MGEHWKRSMLILVYIDFKSVVGRLYIVSIGAYYWGKTCLTLWKVILITQLQWPFQCKLEFWWNPKRKADFPFLEIFLLASSLANFVSYCLSQGYNSKTPWGKILHASNKYCTTLVMWMVKSQIICRQREMVQCTCHTWCYSI